MSLDRRDHFIFDLDGTLTVAAHDFDEIRRILGLPDKRPILETLAAMPEVEARPLRQKLAEWELAIARRSQPQPHAHDLLQHLRAIDARVGILTRNSWCNVEETLAAAGLLMFFRRDDVITRDCSQPKPSPAGIHLLLERWQASPDRAVMVGDYLFDLQAGRAAGVITVHFDVTGTAPWPELADHCVRSLADLRALLPVRR